MVLNHPNLMSILPKIGILGLHRITQVSHRNRAPCTPPTTPPPSQRRIGARRGPSISGHLQHLLHLQSQHHSCIQMGTVQACMRCLGLSKICLAETEGRRACGRQSAARTTAMMAARMAAMMAARMAAMMAARMAAMMAARMAASKEVSHHGHTSMTNRMMMTMTP